VGILIFSENRAEFVFEPAGEFHRSERQLPHPVAKDATRVGHPSTRQMKAPHLVPGIPTD
jgi:hypothetical protein